LQTIDLKPKVREVPLARFALTPLVEIAAKALDLDEHVLVRTFASRRRILAARLEAVSNVAPQAGNLRPQRIDGVEKLGSRVLGWLGVRGAVGRRLATRVGWVLLSAAIACSGA
jgi:hypothetical protein